MNIYTYAREYKTSLTDLAKQADITPNYLYKLASGEMKPSPKVIRALIRVSKGVLKEKDMFSLGENVCKCCGREFE